MASYSVEVASALPRPALHSDVYDLLDRFGFEEISPEAVEVCELALARGFVRLRHLQRTLESLDAAASLPRIASEKFVRHFVDWLEIIHQPYFKPIITSPGRLNTLIGLVGDSLGARARTPGFRIVDFGAGQPPYTTMDLAAYFPEAIVEGVDLYSPSHMVTRADGAYALYEGDRMVAVHSPNSDLLHAMILNWDTTKHTFDRILAASDRGAQVTGNPAEVLRNNCPNRSVTLHRGRIGEFDLPAAVQERVDLIWSFNCLLHYPLEARVQALRTWLPRLRQSGAVMEGYTSPTGSHAVYCLWQRKGAALVLREYGFTLSNLRYPLWPLYERDPQIELLNSFVRTLKAAHGDPAALRAHGLRCRTRRSGFLAISGESLGHGRAARIRGTAGEYPEWASVS
jgi:hypothetical protein